MWMPVMPSPGWNVTSADVVSFSGGVPALASPFERAIEKHDEWAAAMSSSGLVRPFGSSARDAQVTSYVPSPDDSSVTCPEPSSNEPPHRVFAVRVVAMRGSLESACDGTHPAIVRVGTEAAPRSAEGQLRSHEELIMTSTRTALIVRRVVAPLMVVACVAGFAAARG